MRARRSHKPGVAVIPPRTQSVVSIESAPLPVSSDRSAHLLIEGVPAALQRWFADTLPDFEGEIRLSRFGEGQSCLTYLVQGADWSLVLRRPPLGVHPRGAFDVVREFQVMKVLADEALGIPVPHVYALCTDPGVIGAPFYVMELVPGTVLRDILPDGTTQGDLAVLCQVLITTLIHMHSISAQYARLTHFAPHDGYLGRQLQRLQNQWRRVRRRDVPELDRLGAWLQRNAPQQLRTTLIHGDYKLDNVVVNLPAAPEIRAILDWELSTLGDPLADLGWLLYFWREAGEAPFAIPVCSVTDRKGFLTRRDLIERYARHAGLEPSNMNWYMGLAGWKISIIMETSYQRHCDGDTDYPTFARLDEGVPNMARRALDLTSKTL
jgi:aminoglycoside phosphotransferase (APT) family kinase protein